MKFFRLALLVPCSLMLAASCGGSDLDPGAGNDPGTGTSTLEVDGEIRARPRLINARVAGDFETHFSVEVSLNGQPVTTGTVMVTSRTAATPLVFRADAGKWEATAAGYDEVYVLDVASGEDAVEGVRVDGPDLHVFTEPTAGATVDSTLAMRVVWRSEQEATAASIKAEEIDRIAIVDTGSYMLPAGALKAEKDAPRENTIELIRMNRVTPAGAIGSSSVSVEVENRIEVVALANPAL